MENETIEDENTETEKKALSDELLAEDLDSEPELDDLPV